MTYPTFDFDKKQCQHFAESLKTNSTKKAYFQHCLAEFEYDYLNVESYGGDSSTIVGDFLRASDREGRLRNVKKRPFYIWCKRQIEILTDELDAGQSENPELQPSKIQWLGSEVQLVYLVTSLIKDGFLPQHLRDEPFAFIEKHFQNKQGKPFKPKQLSQSKYQYEGNKTERPKNAEIIDKIVEETEKQNQKH